MAIDSRVAVRFARRVLFHALFFSACFQHRRPSSSSSPAFGLLSVVASSVHEAAHIAVGEGLAEDGQVAMMTNMVRRTGHLADDIESELLINPRDEPEPPNTVTAALATTPDVLAQASSGTSEHFAGEMAAQGLRREVEGEQRLETGRRRRLRAHLQPSRKLDGNNNSGNGNSSSSSGNKKKNSNNNNDSKEHSGEGNKMASAEGGSGVAKGNGGGGWAGEDDDMVKFRLGGRVESFMAGNVMQDYLNQLVAESVAATENQVCLVPRLPRATGPPLSWTCLDVDPIALAPALLVSSVHIHKLLHTSPPVVPACSSRNTAKFLERCKTAERATKRAANGNEKKKRKKQVKHVTAVSLDTCVGN